jgi:hypothetical protein
LAIVGAFVALIVLLHVTGATSGHGHHSDISQWATTMTTPTTGT